MAKKKEDLGGVWRTVGGRRIFIKDGQDLYEAMNDSGKFTNLKKTNKAKQGVKEFDKEYELYKKAREDENSIDPMTENSTDWEELDRKYKDRYEKEQSSIKENAGARETNPDGSYKHQEEFEKWKEENNEKIASYYSTTYSKDLENINKDVWNSIAKDIYDEEKMPEKINKQAKEFNSKPDYEKRPQSDVDRENNRNNKITEAIEKGQKDFDPVAFEKWRQEHDPEFAMSDDTARYVYEKSFKKDTLLEKASKIEEIEKELSKVQSRVWNAENDMATEGIEESRWRENPSYNEDRYRLVYLRRDLEEAKDEYWEEKNKINQKRWEKELNSKTKVDKHDLETLNRIADNYENENDYDMDDISKDYIKNRRNEMSFNKRNDEFKANNTVRINNLNQYRKDYFTLGKDDNETKIKIIKTLNDMPAGTELGQNYEENVSGWTSHGGYTSKYQKVLAYKKNEDGSWEGPYGKKDVNDMALSVIHNGADIKTLEQAKADKEKLSINDRTEHRDIVNIGKDSAGNDVGKSTSRTTYNRQIVKDDRYYAWVDEVDPNSELTESELERMYRSIYPNRIKK